MVRIPTSVLKVITGLGLSDHPLFAIDDSGIEHTITSAEETHTENHDIIPGGVDIVKEAKVSSGECIHHSFQSD